MKKNLMLTLIVLMQLSGCMSHKNIVETPVRSDALKKDESINFLLDEETDTVHKFAAESGVRKVISIIKYKEGKPFEVMKLISSESNNGKIHWIYFVPSTKYIVDLTEISNSDTGINIEWKNRTPEGVEDSGSDTLIRCGEEGITSATKNKDVAEDDLPADFPSVDTMN